MWFFDSDNNAINGKLDHNLTGLGFFIVSQRNRGFYGYLENGYAEGPGILFCGNGILGDCNFRKGKLHGNIILYKFAFAIPFGQKVNLNSINLTNMDDYNYSRYELLEIFQNSENPIVLEKIFDQSKCTDIQNIESKYLEKIDNWSNQEIKFNFYTSDLILEGYITYESHIKYERNIINRNRAIELHGCKCQICDFDFEKFYGDIGKNFIEVHHLVPVSNGKKIYNPNSDLITICSNCHQMIHKIVSDNPIEELRKRINPTTALT